MQLCQALGCIPVRHNWKILEQSVEKGRRGAGPENSPPSIGIPSKVRHSAGPRMAAKEQCKCTLPVQYKLLHSSVQCSPKFNRCSSQAGKLPYLQIGIKMHSHPRPHHITPNSTTLICQKGHTFLGQGQFRYDL